MSWTNFGITYIWIESLWLVKTSHMTIFSQPEWIISEWHNNAMLKYVDDIGTTNRSYEGIIYILIFRILTEVSQKCSVQ